MATCKNNKVRESTIFFGKFDNFNYLKLYGNQNERKI